MPRQPHLARRHPGARAAGYPVHRVVDTRMWANVHGATFTDWTAACGHAQTSSGQGPTGPLKDPYRALSAEMCPACWE